MRSTFSDRWPITAVETGRSSVFSSFISSAPWVASRAPPTAPSAPTATSSPTSPPGATTSTSPPSTRVRPRPAPTTLHLPRCTRCRLHRRRPGALVPERRQHLRRGQRRRQSRPRPANPAHRPEDAHRRRLRPLNRSGGLRGSSPPRVLPAVGVAIRLHAGPACRSATRPPPTPTPWSSGSRPRSSSCWPTACRAAGGRSPPSSRIGTRRTR